MLFRSPRGVVAIVKCIIDSPHLHSLERLNINSCSIGKVGDAGAAGMVGMAELLKRVPTNLKYLNIGSNGIGNEGATALFIAINSCINLGSLEVIDLSYNDISGNGIFILAEMLKRSPHMDKLKVIELCGNHIDDDACTKLFETIVDCTHLASLEKINLSRNQIRNVEIGRASCRERVLRLV